MAVVFFEEKLFILLIAGYSEIMIPPEISLIIKMFSQPWMDFRHYDNQCIQIDDANQIASHTNHGRNDYDPTYKAVFGVDTRGDQIIEITIRKTNGSLYFGLITKDEMVKFIDGDIRESRNFVSYDVWDGNINYCIGDHESTWGGFGYGQNIKVNDVITMTLSKNTFVEYKVNDIDYGKVCFEDTTDLLELDKSKRYVWFVSTRVGHSYQLS